MKFTWFNLMPWPYLPDDFREKNRSVWVDIDQALFDPEKSHEVYNTYMDLLEYAGTVGFDGIGVNEHHQNGYGIMPSPNIISAGARAPHQGCRAGRARQLDRALQSAGARRRRVRDARLHLRRPAGRGLPGRHVDGHQLLLRPDPVADAREVSGSARPDHQGVDDTRAVRLQRPLHKTALRQSLAAADPAAASAGAHSGRRLGRDLRLLHRQHLLVLLPVVLRLHPRAGADEGLLGPRRRAQRAGHVAVSRRLRADDLRRRERRGGRAALFGARPLLL